jgi:PAS domain S-box-containing protein
MMLRGKAGEILYTLGMIEDITERKLAVEALRDSEQQYRQLAENIGHVTWLITPDTKQLFYISPNYEQVWGKSCASLYEKPLSFMDIIHPEDKEKAVAALELDSTRMDLEYRIIRSDGTMRWIHTRTHPVLNETGEIYRVVGIAEDITVCKIAEEEILKALQREQELSEAKSRFIAMTSHDLRTPLTTIQSSVDLLKHRSEKLSPERQLLHLDRISSATEQMTSMVQDVLLLSEAEAGNLQFNPALVDLAQLCRSVVADLEVAHKNQHIVEFAVSDEYGTRDLLLDSKLVRYILINLLTNAFKYSRQGSTIQLHLICHPESVVLRIQDQGIGIPAQDIPRLFESFYRASNAGMVEGTGLGLAIVKQCVDLHGGKITVDSAVGKGATFTVTLPLINNGIHSSKIL